MLVTECRPSQEWREEAKLRALEFHLGKRGYELLSLATRNGVAEQVSQGMMVRLGLAGEGSQRVSRQSGVGVGDIMTSQSGMPQLLGRSYQQV